MIRQRIFEYAILFHPAEKLDANGNVVPEKSSLIQDVKRILAKDDKEVAMKAAREIPETYLDQLDLVEICVRPF